MLLLTKGNFFIEINPTTTKLEVCKWFQPLIKKNKGGGVFMFLVPNTGLYQKHLKC